MTGVKVVDASAAAAILFGEAEADEIRKRLEGAQLVAPTLLAYELANVCLVKGRRHPGMREGYLASFALRQRLAIEELSVDAAGAVELAHSSGLSLYDAAYLWLARQLAAELVTLDKALDRAAAARS